MKVKVKLLSKCPTLRDPMDYSLPGSSIHGIFQARVLEWGAIAFSDLRLELPKKLMVFKEATPTSHQLWESKLVCAVFCTPPAPHIIVKCPHGELTIHWLLYIYLTYSVIWI